MEYMTMADIAERLGVARDSVKRYRGRGELPPESRKFGRTPVWESGVVESWIESRPGRGQCRPPVDDSPGVG